MTGKVYLVGAGPGDPGLFTIKGMELLRSADVVMYDALANPELLKECKEGAELIDAGKRARDHHLSQWQTNELLVKYARRARPSSASREGTRSSSGAAPRRPRS